MKPKLIFQLALFLLIFFSCKSQSIIPSLNGIEGTWKVEGAETYEIWQKDTKNNYIGQSYKIKKGKKIVTETLAIKEKDSKVVYEATVLNQNQGQTISFTLNTMTENVISFENLEHDFPKKIQYKVITKDKLLIHLRGEDDQGFQYYLIRQ